MNIVILGDVGVDRSIIHIGDEAMFEEFVERMRRRGAERITGISSAPLDTAARYGIQSVQRIGFAGPTREAQEDRLDRVLRTAAGEPGLLADDDPALGVISVIAASDGVGISGGGNLSSIWPENIFERVAFGRLAALFDRPLVVSGQTIGPVLIGDDVGLVRELLGSARLVGLREPGSFALVSGWGLAGDASTGVQPEAHPSAGVAGAADVRQTVDDASFLGLRDGIAPASTASAPLSVTPSPAAYCLVTLASHVGTLDAAGRTADGVTPAGFAAAVAALLDRVRETTDLDIRFLAHFGSTDLTVTMGDSVVHERVIALMKADGRMLATTDSAEAARLARGADLVITSRYHPAVFAVAAGVPTIGIPVDDYTTVKLSGALGNFGQTRVLPVAALVAGEGRVLLESVWSGRAGIREAGLLMSERNRIGASLWWDDVAGALSR